MPSRRASKSQLNRVNSKGQPMCAYVCRKKLSKAQRAASGRKAPLSAWQKFVKAHKTIKTANGQIDLKAIARLWAGRRSSSSSRRSSGSAKRRSSSARRSAAKKRRSSSARRSAAKKSKKSKKATKRRSSSARRSASAKRRGASKRVRTATSKYGF